MGSGGGSIGCKGGGTTSGGRTYDENVNALWEPMFTQLQVHLDGHASGAPRVAGVVDGDLVDFGEAGVIALGCSDPDFLCPDEVLSLNDGLWDVSDDAGFVYGYDEQTDESFGELTRLWLFVELERDAGGNGFGSFVFSNEGRPGAGCGSQVELELHFIDGEGSSRPDEIAGRVDVTLAARCVLTTDGDSVARNPGSTVTLSQRFTAMRVGT